MKTGTSLAVTLPHEVVQAFKLKAGDAVEVAVHPQTGVISIRAGVRYVEDGAPTKRFKKHVEDLVRRRSTLYRELAK